MTIPLFTKRVFEFGGSHTQVAVKAVDVSQYTEGVVLVRVHANDISAGTGTIDVMARMTAPSSDEPDTDFVRDGSSEEKAKATVDENSAAGDLEVGALSSDFGSFLRIDLDGTMGTSGTVKATLSADLVVKA